MAKNTYELVANLATSEFLDTSSNGVPIIAGKESKIPDQVVGDSFELSILVYDDYDASAAHDFGASASAALYIKTRNSSEDPITLDAAGTVTQSAASEYDQVDFAVNAGLISSLLDNKECVIYAEITDTNEQVTLLQYLKVFSPSGTGAATPESKDLTVSVAQIVAATSAPGVGDDSDDGYAIGDYIWDNTGTQLYKATAVTVGAAAWSTVSALDSHAGTIYYLCDTTAADITVALPTGQAGEIKHIKNDSGANEVTVTGTIKNVTSITLEAADDAQLIRSNAAVTWVNLNFDTFVS